MAARFIVGIDLGTTNTACAFVDTAAGRALRVFEVPQLVAPGEMGARPTLPSFLYLAGAHELPAGSLDPPWTTGRGWRVQLLAPGPRARGRAARGGHAGGAAGRFLRLARGKPGRLARARRGAPARAGGRCGRRHDRPVADCRAYEPR